MNSARLTHAAAGDADATPYFSVDEYKHRPGVPDPGGRHAEGPPAPGAVPALADELDGRLDAGAATWAAEAD